MIFREGLSKVTPNEVLGNVMTNAQYNDCGNEEEEKEEKKDRKEKSVAFKASSSSSKGKSKKEVESDDSDDIDDEAMALLVRKMGKFMKKRGYGARKRRDHMKDNVRLCFNCKSPDYVAVDCPYKSDDDDKRRRRTRGRRRRKKRKRRR
jgi:hypothetical protein